MRGWSSNEPTRGANAATVKSPSSLRGPFLDTVTFVGMAFRVTNKRYNTSEMLFFALAAILAQSSPYAPDEIVLLGRAKNKMAASLSRMPNYTCLQTIERSRRAAA